MKSKKLNFNENKALIMILIFLSGFFIMCRISWAKNDGIIIMEALYNPNGPDNKEYSYEWVRLKNLSEKEVNIRNYEIRLGKFYKPFEFFENIPSESEILIYLGVGINENVDFKNGKRAIVYLGETSSKLGDSKGEMVLYGSSSHNEDTLIDYVLYGGENNTSNYYKQAVNKEIWSRGCFLGDVGEGNNLITYDNGCRYFPEEDNFENNKGYENKIRINEVLPSPRGSDDEGEYIEFYNFGEDDVDFGEDSGWILEDKVGTEEGKYKKLYFKKYAQEKIIKARSFLIIKREPSFSFALSAADEIILRDPMGSQVDRIAYGGAREGISYNFEEKTNRWRWSEFLTPGEKNKFKELGEIEVKIDEDIYKDIYANFEVSMAGVKDKDLTVKWEFGDDKNSYKAKTKHKYLKNGKYVVKLKVSGSSENINKEFNVEVEDFPERKVSILGINPNPQGKDENGEWIELKNKSKKKVNLKNWSIATGASKKKLVNHPIYEDFIIKAGKIKQLTRELSKFSLNNKKGYVELRYPDGEVAYKLKYEKGTGIEEDEIYRKKEGGGWQWVKNKNIVIGKDEDDKEDLIKKVEVETINDLDLIRDMTPADIGKYSEINKHNLVEDYIKEDLVVEQEENKNISTSERQVLGVWDNKIKKIREESGFYYFNPKAKEEKHYLLSFFENIFNKI